MSTRGNTKRCYNFPTWPYTASCEDKWFQRRYSQILISSLSAIISRNGIDLWNLWQEIKATDCEERAEEEELDGHELIPSPDSGKSTDNEAALSPIKIRSDVNGLDHEDCDELIHVENTTQACIMHTLSIVSLSSPLLRIRETASIKWRN